ncbi:MAG: hypothetical protein QM725_04615 [Lacibacter sp.]
MLRQMTIYIPLLLILLTSCNSATSDTDIASATFNNVDSALNYCKQSKEYKSLLFALVTKDVDSKQKLGWAVLGDKDVIATAKKDYVLIIIDPTKISIPNNSDTKDFHDILKMDKGDPYFVVTNHVFYPFRQFTLKTDKETIIDELRIGEGP